MSRTSDTAPVRWARRVATAALLLTVCACSTTRFAYERLDWLARWQLGHYVALTAEQKTLFNHRFADVWSWHRHTELPLWSRELRALAGRIESGSVRRDDIAALFERYGDIWGRITHRLAPLACALGPQLSDAQVGEILAAVDEDLDELRRERVDAAPEAARKEALRAVEKPLRSWLGRLDDEQRTLIRQWNDARPPVARPWFEYRQAWRARLREVLDRRHEAGFCAQATTLIADGPSLWTDAQRRVFADNRQQWIDLFAQLVPTLDARQREHARRRLLDLADDFDALTGSGAGIEA